MSTAVVVPHAEMPESSRDSSRRICYIEQPKSAFWLPVAAVAVSYGLHLRLLLHNLQNFIPLSTGSWLMFSPRSKIAIAASFSAIMFASCFRHIAAPVSMASCSMLAAEVDYC